MVSRATIAATMASAQTGARKISASTIGIRTTAVAMRFSKGSSWRLQRSRARHAAMILARIADFHHRQWSELVRDKLHRSLRQAGQALASRRMTIQQLPHVSLRHRSVD